MMLDMVCLHLNYKAYGHDLYFTIWLTESYRLVPCIGNMFNKLHDVVSDSLEHSQSAARSG